MILRQRWSASRSRTQLGAAVWSVVAACCLAGMALAQDGADTEAQAEPEQEEKAPIVKTVTIDLGVAGRQVSGRGDKLLQYATPPQGIFLRQFTFQPIDSAALGYGLLTLRGVGADDARGDLLLGLNADRTRVWLSGVRNRFVDPTPLPVNVSSRQSDDLTIRHLVAADYAVTLHYGVENLHRYYEAPREAVRRRTRTWELTADGTVGQGNLGAGLSDFRFYDRMLTLPDTTVQTWHVQGIWSPGPEADLGAFASGANVRHSATAAGRINTVQVTGGAGLGSFGDLSFRAENEHASWPGMESAYVSDRRLLETGLASRLGTASVRLRWQYREAERVRGDGSYLDVPKWSTTTARIYGRLTKGLRYTLKGGTERMWQRPQMTTVDTRLATWDSRDSFDARLDTAADALNGYLSWSFKRRGNTVRGTNVTSGIASAGATWTVAPRTEVFAEVSYENWRGSSEVTAYPTLGNFMPDSRVTSLGFSRALDSSTYLWCGYTDTTTNNDNPLLKRDGNTRARYFTLNLRRRLKNGEQIGLSVAPWTYRDAVDPTLNMTATTVVLSGSGRF